MEDFFGKLADLLGRQRAIYGKDEGGAARALAAQQRGLYGSLLSGINNVAFADEQGMGSVGTSTALQSVSHSIIGVTQNRPADVKLAGDNFVVVADLPVLDDGKVQDFLAYLGNSRLYRSREDAAKYAQAVVFPSCPSLRYPWPTTWSAI